MGESSKPNCTDRSHPSALPREPTLQFLQSITNNFSHEIGRGAFGTVYKGVLKNGDVVAVKKLQRISGIHIRRFQNEIGSLLRLEHQNIVKLLGSCYQVQENTVEHNGKFIISDLPEKFLCYEYLPNGSLDDYIYDESSGLDWAMRFKIIMGICNGLHFLHEGRPNEAVVHLNLKPSNILLGDNMVPKIADFGLSRFFSHEQTQILTQNVVGWIGYIAPEYHYRGEISVKSDIFSLGVLILNIVTGLKNDPSSQDISSKMLIENVRKNWTNDSQIVSKYPSIGIRCQLQVKKCIKIGLKCVEIDPNKRPSARVIIAKLRENINETSSYEYMKKELQPISSLPGEPDFIFLKQITMNFSKTREIGSGSFGVVYKGVLQNGEEIAVKRLSVISGISQDKQFQNEVGNLTAVNHKNVVKLLGYCYDIKRKVVESNGKHIFVDTAEKLLCYEYLPQGSLDKYLHDNSSKLNWNQRFKIIEGICQGLQFLHELERPIIHLDLKPGNVLLGHSMSPKIADFGFSRLFGKEQTLTLTSKIIGARGYIAPEYLYRGEISRKSDIFSLGVLIIEIVTGLKVNPDTEDISSNKLIENVRKDWMEMSLIISRYPLLETRYLQQVKLCIDVGLTCVNTIPKERPDIREIVNKLNERNNSSYTS